MRRTTRAALVALLAITLTSGCGSSDEESKDGQAAARLSRPVFPADQEFTQEQLTSALPTARQVPDARRVEIRCRPGRTTPDCQPASRATYAEVILSVKHATRRTTTRNHRKPGYWRPELYDVAGKRFADDAAADAAWDQQVSDLQKIDGPLDTQAAKQGDDGQTWGTRGRGQVRRGKVLGLDGIQVLATIKDVDLAGNTSLPVQVGVVACRWGKELATVKVLFWDAHHEKGEALTRAQAVMEEYLRRLAKSA